jgi:hypothetical protein
MKVHKFKRAKAKQNAKEGEISNMEKAMMIALTAIGWSYTTLFSRASTPLPSCEDLSQARTFQKYLPQDSAYFLGLCSIEKI